MKGIHNRILFFVFLIVTTLLWQSCCKTDMHFSGKVVDKAGKGIGEAVVKVGERESKTNDRGEFEVCVDRAEKYVLNVSALKFGFVSKVYSDTASGVVITMAKATVVNKDPNQDIVVEDVNPEMTIPAGAQASAPASPLDTIPFVYDAQGHLISFTMPQALRETYQAVAQFQPPRRGARISIPAQSLVLEGSDRMPEGNVDISVNTIDLYTPDGMPGDYSVDLGMDPRENTRGRGAMISYGAANIEAFYNGKPLQLGGKKTATLTIPVDTLSIISKESIPDEIPFLIYNKTTGLWEQEGTAKLNASRDAYTKEVSHFSTFNMDMVWSNQSCIQLCDGISPAASGTTNAIDITVPGKTKRMVLPGTVICGAGTTDCAGYGINEANTHAIINLANNIPVTVQVYKDASPTGTGGTLTSTYVLNSGGVPGGAAATYQSCLYNDCAGPFRISDVAACWETTPIDGTMVTPILAVQQTATPGSFIFGWLYIGKIAGGVNDPMDYTVEYLRTDWSADFDTEAAQPANWVAIGDLDADAAGSQNIIASETAWKFDKNVTISAFSTTPLVANETVFFRISFKKTTDPVFTIGSMFVLNYPGAGETLETTFTSAPVPCHTR